MSENKSIDRVVHAIQYGRQNRLEKITYLFNI